MSALAHTANKCPVPAQRWQQIACSDEKQGQSHGCGNPKTWLSDQLPLPGSFWLKEEMLYLW